MPGPKADPITLSEEMLHGLEVLEKGHKTGQVELVLFILITDI